MQRQTFSTVLLGRALVDKVLIRRVLVPTVFVVAVSMLSVEAYAATAASQLGAASTQLYNSTETTASDTQRVRIPVTLKAWNDVDARTADGKLAKTKIIGRPVTHVLRARMEKSNDFYLGDWRIQTTPIRWLRHSQQYQVKLEVFRRFGESGQLEETLGAVTLTGILDKEDDGLYMLSGTARRIFRDKSGEPLLDLDAGRHLDRERGTAVSRSEPQQSITR
jgi:hypothetical protein